MKSLANTHESAHKRSESSVRDFPRVGSSDAPQRATARFRYASVCSGIEAASVAWEPLGWEPAWFSEIEPFPCAVLAHRFPEVPNLGDMTKIKGDEHGNRTIDLLVGGTPCQDLSVAGKRLGFGGERSVLALDFVRLAYECNAKWVVWENVPGVFSSNGGDDFAQFLSLLAGWEVDVPEDGWRNFGIVTGAPGCFGLSWRVLDVQYARVDGFPRAIPQRRRRVFVVGHLGWQRAAQVLFEPEGLLGNTPPRREAGKGTAEGAGGCVGALCARDSKGVGSQYVDEGKCVVENQELFSQNCNGLVLDDVVAIQSNMIGRADSAGCNGRGWNDSGAGYTHDTVGVQGVAIFDARGNGDGVTCPTVTGDHAGRPTDYTPVVCSQVAPTLDCSYATKQGLDNQHIDGGAGLFVQYETDGTASTMKQRDYKDATDLVVAFAQNTRDEVRLQGGDGEICGALAAQPGMKQQTCMAFNNRQNPCVSGCVSNPLGSKDNELGLQQGSTVRRLTPRECERLMGFPDDWTRIPWRGKPAEDCPDGPRYKACGNSMGVNVMRWIGRRIQSVESQN